MEMTHEDEAVILPKIRFNVAYDTDRRKLQWCGMDTKYTVDNVWSVNVSRFQAGECGRS